MKQFRANESRILIATDISAQGIDINDVTHVINYDLPEKPLLEEIEKLIMKESLLPPKRKKKRK